MTEHGVDRLQPGAKEWISERWATQLGEAIEHAAPNSRVWIVSHSIGGVSMSRHNVGYALKFCNTSPACMQPSMRTRSRASVCLILFPRNIAMTHRVQSTSIPRRRADLAPIRPASTRLLSLTCSTMATSPSLRLRCSAFPPPSRRASLAPSAFRGRAFTPTSSRPSTLLRGVPIRTMRH